MAKNSAEAYGAEGRSNLLFFDPEKLVLVTDEKSPLYDERVHLPVNERMVANIMYHGVKQPINVRKNPETGLTEVVAGRQRVKNAVEANRRLKEQGAEPLLVPATVQGGKDGDIAAIMVSENEIRENDTPLGRAGKMQRLLGFGKTEEQLATIFGVTGQTVKYHLALLECTAAVRKAVDNGQINVSHAKALAKLEPDEQRAKVAELVAAGDGVKGHEKSRKQREVLDNGKPKVKTKKEIKAEIDRLRLEDGDEASIEALLWVIGEIAAE